MIPAIIKNLFLSKKWFTAFLAFVGATAAYWGFNVPITPILVFVSPFMIYIGAQGWADSGKEKAIIEQQTEKLKLEAAVKMHEATLAQHRSDRAYERDAPRQPQAGVANSVLLAVIVVVMSVVAMVVLMITSTSCGPTTKPIVTDVIDCAKAEAAAIAQGRSVLEVVGEVVNVLTGHPVAGCEQSSNILECDVEHLVLQFGEDIVACAIDSIPEPAAGSGSTLPQATLIVARKHEALKHFAGKKIVHDYAGSH